MTKTPKLCLAPHSGVSGWLHEVGQHEEVLLACFIPLDAHVMNGDKQPCICLVFLHDHCHIVTVLGHQLDAEHVLSCATEHKVDILQCVVHVHGSVSVLHRRDADLARLAEAEQELRDSHGSCRAQVVA